MLGKLNRLEEGRVYLAGLAAVTREQKVQVQQATAQLYRDASNYKTAYDVLEKALANEAAFEMKLEDWLAQQRTR